MKLILAYSCRYKLKYCINNTNSFYRRLQIIHPTIILPIYSDKINKNFFSNYIFIVSNRVDYDLLFKGLLWSECHLKNYPSTWMEISKLSVIRGLENQISAHTSTHTEYISLSRWSKNKHKKKHAKMVFLTKVRLGKGPVSEIGMIYSILFRTKRMYIIVMFKMCFYAA